MSLKFLVTTQKYTCMDFWWMKWYWGGISPSTSISPANFQTINYSKIINYMIIDVM